MQVSSSTHINYVGYTTKSDKIPDSETTAQYNPRKQPI